MSGYVHPCLVDDGNMGMLSPTERAFYNTQLQQKELQEQRNQKANLFNNGHGSIERETERLNQDDQKQYNGTNNQTYKIPVQRWDGYNRSANENQAISQAPSHLSFLYDKAQGGEYPRDHSHQTAARLSPNPEYAGFGNRANPAPAAVIEGASNDAKFGGRSPVMFGSDYRRGSLSSSNGGTEPANGHGQTGQGKSPVTFGSDYRRGSLSSCNGVRDSASGGHGGMNQTSPISREAGEVPARGSAIHSMRTRTPSPSRWNGTRSPAVEFGTTYAPAGARMGSNDPQAHPPLPPMSTHPLVNGNHAMDSRASQYQSEIPSAGQQNGRMADNACNSHSANFAIPDSSKHSSGSSSDAGIFQDSGINGIDLGMSRGPRLLERSPSPDILKQRTLNELAEKLAKAQVSRQVHRGEAANQRVGQDQRGEYGGGQQGFVQQQQQQQQQQQNDEQRVPRASGLNRSGSKEFLCDTEPLRNCEAFQHKVPESLQGQGYVQTEEGSHHGSVVHNGLAHSPAQGQVQGQGQVHGEGQTLPRQVSQVCSGVNKESLRNYETWKAAVNQRKMSLPGYMDSGNMARFHRQVPPTELPKPFRPLATAELDASSIRQQLREEDPVVVDDYEQDSIRYKGKMNPSKTFRQLQTVINSNENDIIHQHLQSKPPARRRVRKEEDNKQSEMAGSSDDIVDISYVGGKIPSRTFRQLQEAMGEDDYSIWNSSPWDRAPSNPARHVKVVHLRRHSVDNIL